MPYKDKFGVVYGTLEFRTFGNYGSTIYDPLGNGREFLIVNICDKCVREAADRGHVKEATVIPRPDKVSYKRWHHEVEDD